MTPILIFLFGIVPVTAVGTDLLFAALTKAGGVWAHGRRGTINWKITALLAAGSLPAALLTLFMLEHLGGQERHINDLIAVGLGLALILTSLALIFKRSMHRFGEQVKVYIPRWRQWRGPATVVAGAVLGVLVPISSIGAGALGAAMLLFLYPSLPAMRIVGTDLAHAVPLTALAGLGHLQMGTVDLALLASLLAGSLPGIYLGSHISTIVPEKIMRTVLASMLMLLGVKFIFVS